MIAALESLFVLFVPGLAQPAGSKRGFVINGRAVITDANAKSRPWKTHVSALAREAWGDRALLDEPLFMSLDFTMPRPRSHFGTGKNAAKLKPAAPVWHASKPDRSKLTRAVEDALTGVLWRDDTLVVAGPITKRYGEKPGVSIRVCPISMFRGPDGAFVIPSGVMNTDVGARGLYQPSKLAKETA